MKKNRLATYLSIAILLTACSQTKTVQQSPLSTQVELESTWKYLEKFQEIADQNNNNRAVGSPGGIASTDYITNTLKEFGLYPQIQDFTNSKGGKGKNVIVEIKGQSDSVTMIGAHYDSVEFGPGINDNATGTAILLEIISKIQSQKITPKHTLRFAFWDSEEVGVAGSKHYVSQLNELQKKYIAQYINVDMVGTKDPTILILDGDGTSWSRQQAELLDSVKTEEDRANIIELINGMKNAYPKQVKGAEKLEKIYGDYLNSKDVKFADDYMISNSTDVFPFLGLVPTFGLIMTNEKSQDDGVLLYAPCYHQACDDIKNVDRKSLQIALESITHLIEQVAIK